MNEITIQKKYLFLILSLVITIFGFYFYTNVQYPNLTIFNSFLYTTILISIICLFLFFYFSNKKFNMNLLQKISANFLFFCLSFLLIFSFNFFITSIFISQTNIHEEKFTISTYHFKTIKKYQKCSYIAYWNFQNNSIQTCISKKQFDQIDKNPNKEIMIKYQYNLFGFNLIEIRA